MDMETFVEPLFMGMMWLAARGILLSDWWANDLYDKHIDRAIHAFQGGRFNKKQKIFIRERNVSKQSGEITFHPFLAEALACAAGKRDNGIREEIFREIEVLPGH